MPMEYWLEVRFDITDIEEDLKTRDLIDEAVGTIHDEGGMGFGQCDMEWIYITAATRDAALEKLNNFDPKPQNFEAFGWDEDADVTDAETAAELQGAVQIVPPTPVVSEEQREDLGEIFKKYARAMADQIIPKKH
jgi:hypothetical protein